MKLNVIAFLLYSFSSLSFAAEPGEAQQIPDSYKRSIEQYSQKAKDIAKGISSENRNQFKSVLHQVQMQQIKTCNRLAKSAIPQERTAAARCLKRLNNTQSPTP